MFSKQNAIALFSIVAFAGIAEAVPLTTELPSPSNPFVGSVSSSDLLQTNLSSVTFTGSFDTADGGPDPVLPSSGALTDGIFRINGGNPADNSPLVAPLDGATITFTLSNPLGYNITKIDTYGGWNDNGRDRQNFIIEYATVGAPGIFLPADLTVYEPANADGGPSPIRSEFSFAAGVLTNVGSLRFTYPVGQENGYGGVGEIDVFGAVVPEPSSLLLLGLGSIGLVTLGRRKA